jgi:peptide/nickel transport system substrate-binding protein
VLACACLLVAASTALDNPLEADNGTIFRYANDGDVNSMDPHARQETFLIQFMANIYEPLARRDRDLRLEPALATAWELTSPTVWRYTLRRGVTFHEGEPFTADDVVFSYDRARAEGSDMKSLFASVAEVRKVDDFTVELVTALPDPVLPDKLTNIGIMSKPWAEAHGATRATDMKKNEENYATRHANGTGPFRLKSREPDVKTVLEVNPDWWDKRQHNIREVEFYRIANPATRVAALLTSEVDFLYTVPPADEQRLASDRSLKVLMKPELRVIFLGMDQHRKELLGSSIRGRNPFNDLRVRQAMLRAIDVEAIYRTVMRGQSMPTALMVARGIHGRPDDLDVRPGRSRLS